MKIPSLERARAFLAEAEALNPGPWANHSRKAAEAARRIAERHPGLDADAAEVLGLLHDIGRREGPADLHHIIVGYDYLRAMGYDDAARVCLTHSFPIQDIRLADGNWDGTPEELERVARFLNGVEYDDYDRLIQLCDSLALPDGFCLIEKRLVDVAVRRGVNALTPAQYEARFAAMRKLEQAMGCSIYAVLPGVVEGTFGFDPCRD